MRDEHTDRFGAEPARPDGPPREETADLESIRRAVAGDLDAQGDLWRAHRGWLAVVLLAHMPHEAEVDDLLQEVAIAVMGALPRLERVEAFEPFLRRIAVNVARSAGRRAARSRRRAADDAHRHALARRHPDHDADDRAAVTTVVRLVQALPEPYREPLLLHAVRGLRVPQIARLLEVRPRTVETRIHRARKLLRAAAGPAGLERVIPPERVPAAGASRAVVNGSAHGVSRAPLHDSLPNRGAS